MVTLNFNHWTKEAKVYKANLFCTVNFMLGRICCIVTPEPVLKRNQKHMWLYTHKHTQRYTPITMWMNVFLKDDAYLIWTLKIIHLKLIVSYKYHWNSLLLGWRGLHVGREVENIFQFLKYFMSLSDYGYMSAFIEFSHYII